MVIVEPRIAELDAENRRLVAEAVGETLHDGGIGWAVRRPEHVTPNGCWVSSRVAAISARDSFRRLVPGGQESESAGVGHGSGKGGRRRPSGHRGLDHGYVELDHLGTMSQPCGLLEGKERGTRASGRLGADRAADCDVAVGDDVGT